jgi:hypothetical protein
MGCVWFSGMDASLKALVTIKFGGGYDCRENLMYSDSHGTSVFNYGGYNG